MPRDCEVAIIGGGVSGASNAFMLSKYTDVGDVVLLEKESGAGMVNSNPNNNAQTSHDGGTETNYNLAHALEVQHAAKLLRHFVTEHAFPGLSQKTGRMALGLGTAEVDTLRRRFAEFSPFYPDLRLVGPDELREIEPKVMEGRDKEEPVIALFSSEGFAVNYQKLAEALLYQAEQSRVFSRHFNTSVRHVRREGDHVILETNRDTYRAKVAIFTAGAYSLHFAHMLGYAKQYGVLCVAGNFYGARGMVKNKVYRVQREGLPFAAVHADPSVLDAELTRYGPTTRPVLKMERNYPGSIVDFMRMGWVSGEGIASALQILAGQHILGYVGEQALYDVPVLGKRRFLEREARRITPSLNASDLTLLKGAGGVRPQLVDFKTRRMEMGDKMFVFDNCIVNTTPSPGASVSLRNGKRDSKAAVKILGNRSFDHDRFARDFGLAKAA